MHRSLLTLLLLTTLRLNAQQWNWAADAGGGGNTDFCYGIATDSQGNAYWAGSVSGTADFGCGMLTPGNTIAGFVAKVDANGVCQWTRAITTGFYDAWAYAIAIDHEDRIYIAGSCQGNADFGNGIVLSGSGSSDDWFVARYDTAGNCIWARRITGQSGPSEVRGLSVDAEGGVYACGFANGSTFTLAPITVNTGSFFRQAVIAKYDSTGTVQWARATEGSGADKNARAITIAGDRLFVTGQMSFALATYDGLSLTPNANSGNLYVLACDLNGNGLWARSYSNGDNEGYGIAADTLGNLFVVGRLWGDLFLPDDTLSSVSNDDDILLIGLSQQGDHRWAKSTGSVERDLAWSVTADGLGNAYMSAHFNNTIDLFGTPFTALGSEDILIAKMEADGDLVWAQRPSGYQRDIPLCIHRQTEAPHKLYFGGYFWGAITYGGSTIDDVQNGDAMIVSGIDTTFDVSLIATYVCPATCDGMIEPFANGSGPFTFQWNTGDTAPLIDGLCPGMYIVEVTDANGQTIIDTVYIGEHPDPGYTVQVLNDSLWTSGGNAWQWFFAGGTLISDSASAIATETGAYHSVVTDVYGCTWSTDTVTVVLNTGIDAPALPAVRVSPIPSSTFIQIDRSGGTIAAALLDAQGRRVRTYVLRTGRTTVDLHELPNGLYILATDDGHRLKVVKE